MAQIAVTARASADIDEIIDHLGAEAGLLVAARYEARFDALFGRLGTHPRLGAPRARLGRHVRIALIVPFVVIYRYVPGTDTAIILRVLHGRRQASLG